MARWNNPIEIECAECGNTFLTLSNTKKLCSPECRVSMEAKRFAGVSGCWDWQKSRNPKTGYGQLSSWEDGKRMLYTAHRVSFRALVGEIPDGLFVLHKCDNRACFNPEHLFLGTQQDNITDMHQKGRNRHVVPKVHWTKLYPEKVPRGDAHHLRRNAASLPSGEKHHNAKLTNQQAKEVRQSNETLKALSERYRLSESALSLIRRGIAYKS